MHLLLILLLLVAPAWSLEGSFILQPSERFHFQARADFNDDGFEDLALLDDQGQLQVHLPP